MWLPATESKGRLVPRSTAGLARPGPGLHAGNRPEGHLEHEAGSSHPHGPDWEPGGARNLPIASYCPVANGTEVGGEGQTPIS